MPVFMNSVPDEADEEADELALRHGVDAPRLDGGKGGKAGKGKPAPEADAGADADAD
jgi:hypothetical protein